MIAKGKPALQEVTCNRETRPAPRAGCRQADLLLPASTIVGLPDAAVNEAKERVRAAVRNSGLQFPLKRITVNLAPADLRKDGPSYDLPMAVGVLRASEQMVFAIRLHRVCVYYHLPSWTGLCYK